MLTYGLALRLTQRNPDGSGLRQFQEIIREWHRRKHTAADGNTARIYDDSERRYSSGDATVWEYALSQEGDYGGTWTTEVRALESEASADGLHVTVAMRLKSDESEEAEDERPRVYVETPAFVHDLPEHFDVSSGGVRLDPAPARFVTADSIARLVASMSDRRRRLPIIVIAEPAKVSPPIPDLPARLARFLFGLAEVALVEREATFDLTDRIGKEMSCFDGGLRVYWPGWLPTDSTARHPLFLRHRLAASAAYNPAQPDKMIRSTLMALMVRAALTRFSYPPEMVEVIAHEYGRLLRAELAGESPAKLIERVNKLTEELNNQKALAELAVAENSKLSNDLEDMASELKAVTAELERLRAQLQPAAAAGDPEVEPSESDSNWAIEDVGVALERCRTEFAETLIIPRNVFVETSMPGGIWYHVLLALHELCGLERRGEAKNKRDLLRDLLMQHAMIPTGKYKVADTGVSITNPETGQTVKMRQRVHLREGSPAETESLYWETVGEQQSSYKYLIGRLGRHA